MTRAPTPHGAGRGGRPAGRARPLCTIIHPLHTRCTKIFGTSFFSEATKPDRQAGAIRAANNAVFAFGGLGASKLQRRAGQARSDVFDCHFAAQLTHFMPVFP